MASETMRSHQPIVFETGIYTSFSGYSICCNVFFVRLPSVGTPLLLNLVGVATAEGGGFERGHSIVWCFVVMGTALASFEIGILNDPASTLLVVRVRSRE
jgi:hypothetical protein